MSPIEAKNAANSDVHIGNAGTIGKFFQPRLRVSSHIKQLQTFLFVRRVMLLAARMPDAECDGPGEWLPASGNTGAVSFPLRFTPT